MPKREVIILIGRLVGLPQGVISHAGRGDGTAERLLQQGHTDSDVGGAWTVFPIQRAENCFFFM